MPSGNTNSDGSDLGPKVAAQVHELYSLFKPVWTALAHVREGTGGFLSTGNDSYLVAHPREWLDHSIATVDENGNKTTRLNPNPKRPSPKLTARRKLARYENVASSILESKKAVLFREQPTRRVGENPNDESDLQTWWEDVDGEGTHIDDAVPAWWDLAATFGHVVLYFDLPDASNPEQADGYTAADQAMPYVRPYTPLDVLDWRVNDVGRITWIKLLEAYTDQPTETDAIMVTRYRVRVVDEQSWYVYDYKSGAKRTSGTHNLGVVPVVFLFGKRRALLAQIGESVLGDPRSYIDLFNLESEKRELLRGQTFSFINLPLGTGPDAMGVTEAQNMMGQQTGTMNVLFSPGAASVLTGDPANVESYEAAISNLKRELFRNAGVQWETDSKDAEALGSLELKREEMNTRIALYADECQQTEYDLACLFYRWKYGADTGDQKLEDDQVVIHYPERFAQTPFMEVLEQGQAAQLLGMPAPFLKALRKALVTKFEGMANLPQSELDAITKAIDDAPDDPTPAEKQRQKMDILSAAVKGGGAGNGGAMPPLPPGARNVEGA